jgi:hypothetical protein
MSIVSFAVFVRLSLIGATEVKSLKTPTGTVESRGSSEGTELAGILHVLARNVQNIGPILGALLASFLFFTVAIIGTAQDIIAK